jgi:hypothetical protein
MPLIFREKNPCTTGHFRILHHPLGKVIARLMLCAIATEMLLCVFVGAATGIMGAEQYICLRQEHFAELFLSIVAVEGG